MGSSARKGVRGGRAADGGGEGSGLNSGRMAERGGKAAAVSTVALNVDGFFTAGERERRRRQCRWRILSLSAEDLSRLFF